MRDKVPLRVEQALDLILGLPAHRSSNKEHAKFGQMLIEEYFVKLRNEYKEDVNAYMYLNNLFAAIASAVRAFSIQRDIFQTKWNTLNAVKNSILDRANRIEKYSPFNGNIGKIISLFISLSSSGIITKPRFDSISSMGNFVFLIPLFFLVVMFVFDYALEVYRERLIKKAENILPESLMKTWQEENLAKYKLILKNFLVIAIDIHKKYYPDEKLFDENIDKMGKNELDLYLDRIVEKHMAFYI